MRTFFQDEFLNNCLLKRLTKEIKKEQLSKTIEEIDYLNELQSHLVTADDFTFSHKEELEFIKKFNARKRNLQA